MFKKSFVLFLLGILFLATLASCGKAEKSREATPLDKLAEVGGHLNKGGAEFLKGTDPATAFQPWMAPPNTDASEMNALRDELKSAGVASLTNMGFEFELYFLSGGKAIYYLRTFVHADGDGASFLNFEGRSETSGPSGVKIDNLSGPAQPLREAVQALLEKIKGPDCATLPFTDSADVSKLITSEKMRGELVQSMEKAKANMAGTCSALASLKYDEVRLNVDDQAFAALGADGSTKGVLRGEFELVGSNIGYALGSFRRS